SIGAIAEILPWASTESGFFQAFHHLVARRLRPELLGEDAGIEERRQTCNNGTLFLGVPVFAHAGIGRREDRMCEELSVSSGSAGQGAVKCIDGLDVAVQEIMRHAQVQSCPSVGAVEAERSFEPGNGIGGFARKYQNDPAISKAIRIAGIDLKSTVDLPQCEIIMSSEEMDNGEQAVGAGSRRVERQCLLHQP